MKHVREIIISPLISEKSTNLKLNNNCYVFKVSINANKIEIRHAIEKIFNVKVEKVNTIRQRGKNKTNG
jgi:large subunit ribosomal protein L23